MQFNSDSAKLKHNAGMSRDDLEQGYEVLSDEGMKKLCRPSNADVRLGQCSEWDVRMSCHDSDD